MAACLFSIHPEGCVNHVGHFAAASEALAKALFFGGVTRRFPDLPFAFLEGGVAWGVQLLADLLGRMGSAKEVASVAAFLVPDAASFMTGCDVLVDGGFTSSMPL